MKEKLAAVRAPVKILLKGLVVGQPARFSSPTAHQVDLSACRIFQAMRDRRGDPRDLRSVGLGSNLLNLIVTVADRLRQRRHRHSVTRDFCGMDRLTTLCGCD